MITSLLHFFHSNIKLSFLNGNRKFAKDSYCNIYKCHIVRVESISRHEEYACKVFVTSVERNVITTTNMEVTSCSLVHTLFINP